MKTLLSAVFLIILISTVQGQDMIYLKNGNVIRCKINEIKTDLILYNRTDITNSPECEVKKEEVIQVKYKNKVLDKSDPGFQRVMRDSLSGNRDTATFAMIYIVFDPAETTQIFPVYIGGKYVCTLRHHSRLADKIFSQGQTEISRISNDRTGPSKMLNLRHGCTYAIAVGVKDEQITEPGRRFYMTVYEDQAAAKSFIEQYYQGFDLYASDDHHLTEKL